MWGHREGAGHGESQSQAEVYQGLGIRELHSWDPLLPPGLLKGGTMEGKDFILVSPSSLLILLHHGQGKALASTTDRPFIGTVDVRFFSRTLWETRVGLDDDTSGENGAQKGS